MTQMGLEKSDNLPRDRSKVMLWVPFIKLLNTAMTKVPACASMLCCSCRCRCVLVLLRLLFPLVLLLVANVF